MKDRSALPPGAPRAKVHTMRLAGASDSRRPSALQRPSEGASPHEATQTVVYPHMVSVPRDTVPQRHGATSWAAHPHAGLVPTPPPPSVAPAHGLPSVARARRTVPPPPVTRTTIPPVGPAHAAAQPWGSPRAVTRLAIPGAAGAGPSPASSARSEPPPLPGARYPSSPPPPATRQTSSSLMLPSRPPPLPSVSYPPSPPPPSTRFVAARVTRHTQPPPLPSGAGASTPLLPSVRTSAPSPFGTSRSVPPPLPPAGRPGTTPPAARPTSSPVGMPRPRAVVPEVTRFSPLAAPPSAATSTPPPQRGEQLSFKTREQKTRTVHHGAQTLQSEVHGAPRPIEPALDSDAMSTKIYDPREHRGWHVSPGEGAQPPPALEERATLRQRIALSFRAASFARKATVLLLPVALVVALLPLPPRPSDAPPPTSSVAPPRAANAALEAGGIESVRPAAPGRATLPAIPAGQTLSRLAADRLAAGEWEQALNLYRGLEQRHPEQPVYKETVRIIERQLKR